MQKFRIRVALSVGISVSLLGAICFGAAHGLTAPASGVAYDALERQHDTSAWRLFGCAVTLGGLIITAAALAVWCRDSDG